MILLTVCIFIACNDHKPVVILDNRLSPGDVEKVIAEKEDQWGKALNNDDSASFEKILSKDFTFINPDGTVMNRKQYIADRSHNKIPTDSFKLSEFKVNAYGNTALASGVTEFYGSDSVKQYVLQLRWKELWMLEDGDWKVVAGQGTPINPDWLAHFVVKSK
ncbi:MAG: nuclear transport factor 2 family protein [Chitinophagaceae bacterium]